MVLSAERGTRQINVQEAAAMTHPAVFTYRRTWETFDVEGVVSIHVLHESGRNFIPTFWSRPGNPEVRNFDIQSKKIFGDEDLGVYIRITREHRLHPDGRFTPTGRHKVGIQAPEGIKITRRNAQTQVSSD